MIKIGSFFPVNFDIDEILIHKFCSCFIFKTFFFHYMTPMASGIPNANQYWFILILCPLQSFFTPGIPVNGIMCMLQKVWTGFIDEMIRKFLCLHDEVRKILMPFFLAMSLEIRVFLSS